MQPGREEVVARERRWSLPVALATLGAIGLLVAAEIVPRSVGGDGAAEVLRSVTENSSAVIASGILKGLAFLLLVAPLVYLFRAAQARSERVFGALIGLVIAGPIFLCSAAILFSVTTNDAASEFVAGEGTADLTATEARERCESDREDDEEAFREDFGTPVPSALRRCAQREVADERAEDAVAEAPTRSLGIGLEFAGRLGLAVALLYSCLWAMRTGLLTRFWGSLGMAMGAAALLLLIQFTFIWFLYFALLVAGWVPGGRPPAWAAGEAIPWPTPGQEAAERLGGGEPPEEGGSEGEDQDEPPAKRKRKQRM
ncbi:MAG TPA: hypothetical protein VFZ41_10660 [Solirubrobacterales bacterium]